MTHDDVSAFKLYGVIFLFKLTALRCFFL